MRKIKISKKFLREIGQEEEEEEVGYTHPAIVGWGSKTGSTPENRFPIQSELDEEEKTMTEEQVKESLKRRFPRCKFVEVKHHMFGATFILRRRRQKWRGNIEVHFRRRGL